MQVTSSNTAAEKPPCSCRRSAECRHGGRTNLTSETGICRPGSGRYDGEFDKTDLPDELILTNYFTVRDGMIARLFVIRNTPAEIIAQ